MNKLLALVFVLPLAGCAGGQPRMAIQTANQAEDAERLTSMMQNCYDIYMLGGRDQREVRPFVEMTPEDASTVATELLRLRILPFRAYGGSKATRITADQAYRVGSCLRDRYELPIDLTTLQTTTR